MTLLDENGNLVTTLPTPARPPNLIDHEGAQYRLLGWDAPIPDAPADLVYTRVRQAPE